MCSMSVVLRISIVVSSSSVIDHGLFSTSASMIAIELHLLSLDVVPNPSAVASQRSMRVIERLGSGLGSRGGGACQRGSLMAVVHRTSY